MRKVYIAIALLGTCLFSSCDTLNDVAGVLVDTTTNTGSNGSGNALTNDEVISGLKEALNVGIKNSVDLTSVQDGFNKNTEIRLPFPPDAIKVKEKAEEWGLNGQVTKFEETLNRAAEEASKEALPIFKDAILSMSIQDGFSILNGGDGAATRYLSDKTTAQLTQAFAPKVDDAIAKVELTKYWEPIVSKYNAFAASPFSNAEQVNPDLSEYVTQLAIQGLFKMVEKEENKIRQDPVARITDILQRVFGSIGQ